MGFVPCRQLIGWHKGDNGNVYISGRAFLDLTTFIALACVFPILFEREVGEEFSRYHIAIENSRYWVVRHVYLALMIALIVLFGVLGGDQFIYFQF